MSIDESLKKIRTKIKYGRAVAAEKDLELLLSKCEGSQDEQVVLTVLIFEFLKKLKDYKKSIPHLQRLLSLNIDQEVRSQAEEFLSLCEKKESLSPSYPDGNNAEFVEFMDVVKAGEIFLPPNVLPDKNKYLFVEKEERAEELAWNQDIEAPFVSWNMLRTQASKTVHSHYFENKISMRSIQERVSNELHEICKKNILPEMINFYDDIYSDLLEIARGKLVGVVPDLHARMWEAYKSKVYPCGWFGEYPEGKLCIFPNKM